MLVKAEEVHKVRQTSQGRSSAFLCAKGACLFLEIESHYVAQAVFELRSLMPPPPKDWQALQAFIIVLEFLLL